ncbi:hypothetical protein GIB67_026879 [Kingdonia uniflora]|uniref:Uncharacterized protein n=1 Tax=Kingdonia uniflora TaxID=39325 RepID=A0A7J7M877_9MAGN|nr:hypothetical protein GIB67_026879 [Kingdonia uniflora]
MTDITSDLENLGLFVLDSLSKESFMDSSEQLLSRKKLLRPLVVTCDEEEGNPSNDKEIIDEQPLSPAFLVFHEPQLNCYVVAIIGSKTRLNPDVIKAGLERTLLNHPHLSSIQVTDDTKHGELKFVRTKVDLENHVYIPDIDPNMDSPEKFIEDYLYNIPKNTMIC